MNQDFECIKIKDGLYLGNIVAAHDYQFLVSNKFGYVVNCTAEIPNVFEHQNVKYLKFKLVENKPHKLWDQTLKKINKLEKFLEDAEETSLCCLVHSFRGENRSLVFVTAYLMKKYQWRLKKCLQFLKSKQIFIGLSNHYISQLQILEQILSKNMILSVSWTPPYINQEQQIISKTFINSLEGKDVGIELGNEKKQVKSEEQVKKKSERRVVWADRFEKKKKKEELSQKKAEELAAKIKEKTATHVETAKFRIPEYDMRDTQLLQNLQLNDKKRLHSSENIKIKENLKKQTNNHHSDETKEQIPLAQKNIYQLTINNFISPNFNIINKTEPVAKKSKKKDEDQSKKQTKMKKQQVSEKDRKQRPNSANKKSSHKINRAQSEKQVSSVKGQKQQKQARDLQKIPDGREVITEKQVKEKKSALETKEKNLKKELRKQGLKAEKQKSSHSSLHLMNPLGSLAQQLIKTQQGNLKRSLTPTRKQKKKEMTR